MNASMNARAPLREQLLSDFAQLSASLPGAQLPWLVRARQDAIERFAGDGFPDARDEEWKYTQLAGLEKQAFTAMPGREESAHGAAAIVDGLALNEEGGHLLVFLNGRYSPGLSAPGRLPPGVRLSSISDALAGSSERSDALEPYLTDIDQQTVFGALNTAFMADGAYLHLPRDTQVAQAIHLLFLTTQSGVAISPRNLIVAEEGAQATVIEHYAAADGTAYFTNAVTQIFAAANAQLAHYKLQQES